MLKVASMALVLAAVLSVASVAEARGRRCCCNTAPACCAAPTCCAPATAAVAAPDAVAATQGTRSMSVEPSAAPVQTYYYAPRRYVSQTPSYLLPKSDSHRFNGF